MVPVPPEPPAGWDRDAACAGTDPDWFYAGVDDAPEFYYDGLRWADVCPSCPVRAHCLATAIRNGENWGVWGGLTPTARWNLALLLAAGAVTWEQVVVTFHGRSAA